MVPSSSQTVTFSPDSFAASILSSMWSSGLGAERQRGRAGDRGEDDRVDEPGGEPLAEPRGPRRRLGLRRRQERVVGDRRFHGRHRLLRLAAGLRRAGGPAAAQEGEPPPGPAVTGAAAHRPCGPPCCGAGGLPGRARAAPGEPAACGGSRGLRRAGARAAAPRGLGRRRPDRHGALGPAEGCLRGRRGRAATARAGRGRSA